MSFKTQITYHLKKGTSFCQLIGFSLSYLKAQKETWIPSMQICYQEIMKRDNFRVQGYINTKLWIVSFNLKKEDVVSKYQIYT